MISKAKIHSAILVMALLFSEYASAEWQLREFNVMGTRARVEFWSTDKALSATLHEQVEADMRRIDASMSPYKPDSELSAINQKAAEQAVVVSRELFALIKRSIDYSQLTSGAFDITFSSVGFFYDYRQHQRPSSEQIEKHLAGINYRHLVLNDEQGSVKFKSKGVRIDLGGIAKGHAVDRAIDILKRGGIKHAYVSAGGDSYALGNRGDRPWMIAIKHPRDKTRSLLTIPLENLAISTSGDYERYFDENGVRYHHIINPKTGDSARNSQSVTILADNSTDADALSTSVFVLGPEKGLQLIDKTPNVSAVIVDKDGKVHYSSDLVSIDQ